MTGAPFDLHQQPRIDKLVWEQPKIIIAENGSHLDRSRRGINLVIQSQQLAARNFRLCSAIVDVDRKLGIS
jgi:hypothetical protein